MFRAPAWLLARAAPSRLAIALSVIVLALGIRYTSVAAGGSDSYAYVSQAEFWIHGSLVTPLDELARAPWPAAREAAIPLGYVTSPDGRSMVPMVPIGLPLLMAGAKLLAGQRAIFWIAPAFGAMFVWLTFLIGRRMSTAWTALGAALLVASSPTFLFQFLQPMTDVPAAACWTLVLWLALIESAPASLLAGLAASAAILIRPNLVVIAAVVGLWLLVRQFRSAPRGVSRAAAFSLGVLPGCVIVAWVNNWWYGSPTASGFAPLSVLLSASHIIPNVVNYSRAFAETETPFIVVGFIALAMPTARLWSSTKDAGRAVLLTAVAAAVLGFYCLYTPFDAWWYLRFLLPAFPPLMIGAAVVISRVAGTPSRRAAGAAAVIALAIFGAWTATDRGAFHMRESEQRYASAGQLVRGYTPPGSVILSVQHSGSLRYYAGRMTMRYDWIDPLWLDRAVDWLRERDAHPYLVLDDTERAEFEHRFAGASRLAPLGAPILIFKRAGREVYLYDLIAMTQAQDPQPLVETTPAHCYEPQPPPPPVK